ncbi:MAG: hypothetical protein EOO53_00230 [Gammaproteobacteria bacterium]|nr:MAG: hypothetical protein EOO53_00230 [Gammaproteobacteria bacterium]
MASLRLPAVFASVIIISISGLLAACGTTGRSYTDGKLAETLEIEILPNTSKMFVYRLKAPDDQMPNVRIERGGFGGGGDGGGRGGVALSGSTPKRLLENAGYVVEHMGYCREGFLEIDSSASQFNLWVKGECKEGATEDDVKKFGSKQIIPVRLDK